MAIHDASFSTELRAGLTTFATMAYIIAVNVRFPTGFSSRQRSADFNRLLFSARQGRTAIALSLWATMAFVPMRTHISSAFRVMFLAELVKTLGD
jgi:xanthine/uracil/vitamin C permease (AzgA family)